jgi:hypothetical protein
MENTMVNWKQLNKSYASAEADSYEPPVGEHPFVIDDVKLNTEKGWIRFVGHFPGGEYACQQVTFFNSLDEDKLLYLKKNLDALGVEVNDLEQTLTSLNSIVQGTETVLKVKESGTINRKTGKPFLNKSFLSKKAALPVITDDRPDYPEQQQNENLGLF